MLEDFLMNLLCIYLDEGKGGGGSLLHVLVHIYVLENIVSLCFKTA